MLIPDYTTSARFDLAVLDAHRRRPVDHLLVFSEFDILRAARLRERLGIPGQGFASALAFRDKVRMKRHWADAGVPAAAHAALGAPADLLAFADHVGYPVVVKPRAGMGSARVRVLADEPQARAWLADTFIHEEDGRSAWMAEEYIDGAMLQVDGVYHDRGVEVNWPTSVSSLLACFDGAATTSVTLEPDDPLTPRAQRLVTRALAALPVGGPIVFHAEVWVGRDGTLLMNEVAARIGGGQTRQIVETAFGIDLVRRYVECTVDEDARAYPLPTRPHLVVGDASIPPGHGRLLAPPPLPAALAAAPWMRRAVITGEAGHDYHGAATSVDSVAECLVTGASTEQVDARLRLFTDWCQANLRYADPHAPARQPAALAAA